MTVRSTPTPAKRLLGRKIAVLREQHGYSQRQFAAMICFDRSTLTLIENGAGNPTIRSLERIAEGLEVPIEELFNFATLP